MLRVSSIKILLKLCCGLQSTLAYSSCSSHVKDIHIQPCIQQTLSFWKCIFSLWKCAYFLALQPSKTSSSQPPPCLLFMPLPASSKYPSPLETSTRFNTKFNELPAFCLKVQFYSLSCQVWNPHQTVIFDR